MGTELKKLKCVTPTGGLTVGRVYDQWKESDGIHFFVVDERGVHQPGWYKYRFEEVVEDVPVAETQVGGNHYTKLKIQPYEYVLANGLGPLELNIVKYVTRWKDKDGIKDLKKARHTLDFYIDYLEKNTNA